MVRLLDAKLKKVIKLENGSRVQVHGLENRKELNGLVGRALQFDAVKMRWGVELADGKKIALKMGNLIPLEEPAITPEECPPAPDGNPTPTLEANSSEAAEPMTAPAHAAELPPAPAHSKVSAAPSPEQEPEVPEAKVAAAAASAAAPTAATAELLPDEKDEKEARATQPSEDASECEKGRGDEPAGGGAQTLDDEEWPVLPTSAETAAKMRTGCWFDGGSAAKRFTEQLSANDPKLISICLVPPKRFNEEDAKEICDALDANTHCTELLASGHCLSDETCERLADMMRKTKTLLTLSVGESSLGDRAGMLFSGLAENTSLTSLDLEHKGLTSTACCELAKALGARARLEGTARLAEVRLSRNTAVGCALTELAGAPVPRELRLCECALGAKHCKALGDWALRGVEHLDLRDNSSLGGEGVENLMQALLPKRGVPAPALRKLSLNGCAIGDDGLEAIADAIARGLELEDLSVERCEITLTGCEFLAQALRGNRFRALSVRANVIGDEGCALLARCAERLDLSSTSLTGEVLATLGDQPLVSLELFSNPALGPSVGTWCAALDSSQWQRLEHLDLTGCALKDEGFECVIKALMDRPALMPSLTHLCIGANEMDENEEKCELVDRLGEARGGRLQTVWQTK
mmetsp:Transcript_87940/g.247064  ORF Transcript_87940/g.247064 Transcript_87940/m.247064 type:complete len:639 (-) Transcript_87940:131-2047(-)